MNTVAPRPLGRLYGAAATSLGRWLKGLGLRTKDGRPSPETFAQGYVAQRPSRPAGTYFWVWHTDKTTAILDGNAYPRAVLIQELGKIGQEILDPDSKDNRLDPDLWFAQVV